MVVEILRRRGAGVRVGAWVGRPCGIHVVVGAGGRALRRAPILRARRHVGLWLRLRLRLRLRLQRWRRRRRLGQWRRQWQRGCARPWGDALRGTSVGARWEQAKCKVQRVKGGGLSERLRATPQRHASLCQCHACPAALSSGRYCSPRPRGHHVPSTTRTGLMGPSMS